VKENAQEFVKRIAPPKLARSAAGKTANEPEPESGSGLGQSGRSLRVMCLCEAFNPLGTVWVTAFHQQIFRNSGFSLRYVSVNFSSSLIAQPAQPIDFA
jgi:hypothetical protein